MKKFLVIIAFILGITLGYIYLVDNKAQGKPFNIKPQITAPVENAEESKIAEPTRLVIPKLNIDTSVEHVGLDSKGNMDVPKDPDNVGWYKLGFLPGAKGNSVLAGHLDTETGAPAIFYELTQLKQGDALAVIDSNGKEAQFKVTEINQYAYDKLPLQEIFGESSVSKLHLITCKGNFNQQVRNYSHRYVVTAEPVE